jgi:hypothetical protein
MLLIRARGSGIISLHIRPIDLIIKAKDLKLQIKFPFLYAREVSLTLGFPWVYGNSNILPCKKKNI